MAVSNHEVFTPPSSENVRIWRYMELSKFIWMIQHRALYFCRADMLGDPFEGYYTRNFTVRIEEIIATALQDPKVRAIPNIEATIRHNYGVIANFAKSMRPQLYVNCWHTNEYESPAMWKLYAAHHESICIQSTYKRLADALPETCFLGMVKYLDYNKAFIELGNTLNFIVHKRIAFEHERELRAVIWDSGDPEIKPTKLGEQGCLVPVDINSLIEQVFIGPDAQPILREVVANLASTYGVAAPIILSEVNVKPDY